MQSGVALAGVPIRALRLPPAGQRRPSQAAGGLVPTAAEGRLTGGASQARAVLQRNPKASPDLCSAPSFQGPTTSPVPAVSDLGDHKGPFLFIYSMIATNAIDLGGGGGVLAAGR